MRKLGQFQHTVGKNMVPLSVCQVDRHARGMIGDPDRASWRTTEISPAVPDQDWLLDPSPLIVQRPEHQRLPGPAATSHPALGISIDGHLPSRVYEDFIEICHHVWGSVGSLIQSNGCTGNQSPYMDDLLPNFTTVARLPHLDVVMVRLRPAPSQKRREPSTSRIKLGSKD